MALPRSLTQLGAVAALLVACALLAAPDAPAAANAPAKADASASKAKKKGKRAKRQARRARRSAWRSRHNRRVSLSRSLVVRTAARPAPAPRSSLSSTGDLLFNGSHLADFDLIQAAPDAMREVADPAGGSETAFEITVDESDVYPVTPTENPRAQALSPDFIDPGEEFWLRTKFMLPTDFPEVDGWLCLSQIYGPPFDGPSPWQLGIRGDDLMWQRNGTYDYDIPWQMPLPKGRWVDVLVHQRFASDGWVEMWIDGQQVTFFQDSSYNPSDAGPTQRVEMATVDNSNGGGANHAKIMQYREAGLFDSATVYFGSLLVGTTRASVGA